MIGSPCLSFMIVVFCGTLTAFSSYTPNLCLIAYATLMALGIYLPNPTIWTLPFCQRANPYSAYSWTFLFLMTR